MWIGFLVSLEKSTNFIEIDYIKVYKNGKNSAIIPIKNFRQKDRQGESTSSLYYIIIPLIIVLIIMTILFVLTIFIWKKQKRKTIQDNLEMTYDDCEKDENDYEDYNYAEFAAEHKYDQIHFNEQGEKRYLDMAPCSQKAEDNYLKIL